MNTGKKSVYFNGSICAFQEAVLPVNDLAVLRGFGVFDYLRTYNGKPFMLAEHLQRFRRSALGLGLAVPEGVAGMDGILRGLMQANGLREAGIRMVLTGGASDDGMTGVSPNFIVTAENLPERPAGLYSGGAVLITDEYRRDMPEIKSINYLRALALLPKRRAANAYEVLYHSGGLISEASRSNFFVVKDGRLLTPRHNILKGITRSVTLRLAGEAGIPADESDVSPADAFSADEAFLTGTATRILPVSEIDGRSIGRQRGPGRVTAMLMQRMDELTAGSRS